MKIVLQGEEKKKKLEVKHQSEKFPFSKVNALSLFFFNEKLELCRIESYARLAISSQRTSQLHFLPWIYCVKKVLKVGVVTEVEKKPYRVVFLFFFLSLLQMSVKSCVKFHCGREWQPKWRKKSGAMVQAHTNLSFR